MTLEFPPDKRAEMWVLRIVTEEGGISVGRLRDRVPCGRNRLREALKSLEASGHIFRDGNGLYPTGHRPPESDREPVTDRPKVAENEDLVSPHAPLPKNLKPGSNRAREANPEPSKRDPDPYVVVCTWRESRHGIGQCDFAHQTFFGNRNDAYAHFKAHCRESHPSKDWEVTLVERKTGETVNSWSSVPYEPIPYEVGRLGINAYIKSQLGI